MIATGFDLLPKLATITLNQYHEARALLVDSLASCSMGPVSISGGFWQVRISFFAKGILVASELTLVGI